MTASMIGKKYMGHFCWCCQRKRRNEIFTGRGHRDHICKDCQKLPAKEREVRQAIRIVERLCTRDGFVRKKHRAEFLKYLEHPEVRVRQYAREIQEYERQEREPGRPTPEGEIPF
jgi:hypothetical protein